MTPATLAHARGDRRSELAVLSLVLVALLAGWLLKTTVAGRTVAFSAGNVSAQAPAGWLRATAERGEVLRVSDPAAAGFATTYVIEIDPISTEATPADVVSLLSLQRGQQWMAYRVLDQAPVTVNGRDAVRVTFVYVETDPNVSHAHLPTVVRGEDFVFLAGERAVVVSYRADSDAFELDLERFEQFLASVQF